MGRGATRSGSPSAATRSTTATWSTLHREQVAADAAAGGLTIDSAIGDARALDLPDASVDAVLLLGPIYHLPTPADRVAALVEAGRVVRPGGPIFAVAISRWAPRLARPGRWSAWPRRTRRSTRWSPSPSARAAPAALRGLVQRVLPPAGRASRRDSGRRARDRRSRGRRGDRVRARRPRGAARRAGGAGGRPRRGPGTGAGSGAPGPQPAPPGDGPAIPDLCLAKRFARLRGRAQARVVFENSAVWRSTGPLQVAAVDRRRVRPHPFRRGAETSRPSSAAAFGRFTMGAPTFESGSGLAPATDSPSWSETGR